MTGVTAAGTVTAVTAVRTVTAVSCCDSYEILRPAPAMVAMVVVGSCDRCNSCRNSNRCDSYDSCENYDSCELL